jgi:hypothetical protein
MRQPSELLNHCRNIVIGEAEVSVPPGALDGYEPCLDQL